MYKSKGKKKFSYTNLADSGETSQNDKRKFQSMEFSRRRRLQKSADVSKLPCLMSENENLMSVNKTQMKHTECTKKIKNTLNFSIGKPFILKDLEVKLSDFMRDPFADNDPVIVKFKQTYGSKVNKYHSEMIEVEELGILDETAELDVDNDFDNDNEDVISITSSESGGNNSEKSSTANSTTAFSKVNNESRNFMRNYSSSSPPVPVSIEYLPIALPVLPPNCRRDSCSASSSPRAPPYSPISYDEVLPSNCRRDSRSSSSSPRAPSYSPISYDEDRYDADKSSDECESKPVLPHRLALANIPTRVMSDEDENDNTADDPSILMTPRAPMESFLMEPNLLVQKIKEFFTGGEFCDITLNVKNKEFKAHKIILAAASPVFSSYFKHETLENETGVINILDCDPESFEQFLEYLYCSKVDNISCQSSFHLYKIADKYDVKELQTYCIKNIKHHLNVENFCDIVTFCEEFNNRNLFVVAQDFFNRKLREILVTAEWKNLLKGNYNLANKLLIEMSSCIQGVMKYSRLE